MLQRAVSDDLIEHFGSLHLSLTEIKEAASSIAFDGAETMFNNFSTAVQDVESSLSSVKSTFSSLEKRTGR